MARSFLPTTLLTSKALLDTYLHRQELTDPHPLQRLYWGVAAAAEGNALALAEMDLLATGGAHPLVSCVTDVG